MDRAVKTVAYLRVSTPQQDVRSQRLAILEYARTHDIRIDDFIEATASGQASEKRRRLDDLTNALQRGDRLVVSELSRLGRSLGQIVTILDALAKAGAAFVALKENIRIEGKRDIQTKVMTTLFALVRRGRARPDLDAPEGPRPGEVIGPEARSPEGLAGRLTARRQAGRDPALPRAGRVQDRHRQDHRRVPYCALQLHDHQRAQAEPLACITARMVSVPYLSWLAGSRWAATRSGHVSTRGEWTPAGRRVLAMLPDYDLTVLDPLASAYACSEIDRALVRSFAAGLDAEAETAECPASETRTSKRLRPGASWRSGVIQTMRASTRRAPRSRGVFSGIRPMASSAIRNQTWSPSGASSAPNQKVPFGSRVGSRAVRVLAPPGQSSHAPSMTIATAGHSSNCTLLTSPFTSTARHSPGLSDAKGLKETTLCPPGVVGARLPAHCIVCWSVVLKNNTAGVVAEYGYSRIHHFVTFPETLQRV